MKAATTRGFGPKAVLVIGDTDKPKVNPNEVLVEVHASSVNPKDWKLNTNISSIVPSLGIFPKLHIIGDDLSGVVVGKGTKVKHFEIGDEVYGMNMGLRTAACAEYAVINQKRICKKPSNLSYSEAASAPLAALTALQAFQLGEVKDGSKVLIIGASGGVGTFAVQIAKAMGAQVTGVCSGKNTALVKSLGADETIDYTERDFINDESDFDTVFDATAYQSLSSCSSLMNENGIYVSTGGNGTALLELVRDTIIPSTQKAKSVWVDANPSDLATLKDYFEQGKIKPIIDSEYGLEDIEQAYARSKTGRSVGKIVINIK